jgi:hypothetical protein
MRRARSATRSRPSLRALRGSGRSTGWVDESATGSANLWSESSSSIGSSRLAPPHPELEAPDLDPPCAGSDALGTGLVRSRTPRLSARGMCAGWRRAARFLRPKIPAIRSGNAVNSFLFGRRYGERGSSAMTRFHRLQREPRTGARNGCHVRRQQDTPICRDYMERMGFEPMASGLQSRIHRSRAEPV